MLNVKLNCHEIGFRTGSMCLLLLHITWPTKVEDNEQYGNITVTMQSKKVYGDYSVRKFKLQEDTVCGSPCGL